MDKMKESAHFFLACQKMKEGKDDEALASFKDQKSPYASFYIGEIYKKLALDEKTQTGLLEAGGQMKEFLVESRDAFYLTLDRLRSLGAGAHALDSQLSEQLEEVESLLNMQGGAGEQVVDSGAMLGTPPRRGDPTAARRVLSQLTSTPQSQRSIFDGNISGLRSEARPSPERLDVQMRHLTGELSRTNTELAKTVASVCDSNEVTKVVLAVKDVVETNNRILGEITDNLRNISDDMRELRRDSRLRDERIMDTLKKISDNSDKTLAATATASASASRASELSAEERLLMESFGLTSAGSLATMHLQMQQQQLIQQQLARQTPTMMASLGYGMNSPGMYGAAGMFSPVSSGNIAALPQHPVAPVAPVVPVAQVSQRAPAQAASAPSNVVISVSDPIPHSVPVITAPMTVTVPPQHRLGGLSNSPRGVTVSQTVSFAPSTPQSAHRQREETVTTPQSAYKTPQMTPHSYQMRMPNGASPLTVSPFKVDEDPAVVFTTQSLLSSIPSPVISAVTPSPEKAAPLSVTKTRVASGSAVKAANPVAGEEESPETYEPETEFVPVIPLPEVVDVVTGEEEEEIMFEERSKLFRFSDDTKEWKERGLGQAKILADTKTGKVRFLMRREQTFKICANHQLISNMKLDKMGSNAKARIWGAQDFADEELKTEKFCIRFKTEEQADNFEKKFNEAVVKSAAAKSPVNPTKDVKTSGSSGGQSLAQFAASQKQSSWECGLCLTRTDNSKIQCLACEAAKPGCEDEVKKLKDAAKPPAAVMTIGAGGGFKFGSGGASSTSSGGFNFDTSTSTTTSQSSGFSFGTPSAENKTNGDRSKDGSKSPFGAASFSFSGVKVSPVKPGACSPRKHNESTNSESELYQDDEADNVYFEPVIPLPDKVDTKTGEEEETVIYSHRAKLLRFTSGEWKERGLGDIKILKHEGTGKVRLLMRREQVLKICLNHSVSQQLVSQFTTKDNKSWIWAAQDFSDGELETSTFALRFKTPEISSEFKKALDEAAANSTSSPVKSGSKSKSPEVTSTSTTSKPTEKAKEQVSSAESDEGLFSPADFKPLEELDTEVELSFDGQGMKLNTAEDAEEVCEKIVGQAAVHTLTFSGNTIGIEAAGAIGSALETHPELRRAHWKDMFTGRMKTEIPPALLNMTRGLMVAQARLVELDLSDNAFGPVGMEGLKTFLKSPSCFSLQELKLNNTGCGVTGGKMLASLLLECYDRSKAIGHPLAMKVFILGRSRQENEGATALAKVFKLMGSLEEVVMPQNGIYHEGLTALADAFSCNPNLKILNMNDNTFTAKGAKAMATALKKLNKLEVLNLGDCLLKSGGTKLICRALAGNHPALRELVLDSNEIRLKGGLEIVNAVKDKAELLKLSIDANQFGSSGLKKILTKLEEIGKKDIVGETEDNEEPDSDEEDPDVSDDEQVEETVGEACQPSQPFSFKTKETKSPAQALLGTSSKTIFGGSGSNNSIFGGSANTTSFKPAGNIFTSPPSTSNSVFGNTTTNTTNNSPAIFGGSGSGSTSSSIFGTPTTTARDSKEATPSSSVFTRLSDSKDSTPAFGSSVFGSSTSGSTGKPGGLFGKGPSPSEETTPSSTTGSAGSLFGTKSQSGFDFKSLAENSGPGFNTAGEGFKFAGAGASLFGKQNKSVNEEGEEDEDAEADSHDPHFEPIVPLPELVEVKTGEEEEEEVFKHRSKVYRFCSDTKQWKERGVGDIKILRHPATGVTRVILRRDQVYKIALNHRITKEMELNPLSNSETAWCWYAMDFSEGHEETGSMEQLAVRFKGKDTAEAFKAKFEECQENIGKVGSASASVIVKSSSAVLNESTVSEEAEDKEGDEEEDEYVDDEEYDNGDTLMFHNTANLYLKDRRATGQFISQVKLTNTIVRMLTCNWQGEVDLKIVYDDDVYGARILAELPTASSEEESIVCNHLIAMQTNLVDLEWSALDFSTDPPAERTFRVVFEDEETSAEFKDIFDEGKIIKSCY